MITKGMVVDMLRSTQAIDTQYLWGVCWFILCGGYIET